MPAKYSGTPQPDVNSDEYYAVPVMPADDVLHSVLFPFCSDPSCPCHEDPSLIAPLNEAYQNGELTADEATDIYKGKKL